MTNPLVLTFGTKSPCDVIINDEYVSNIHMRAFLHRSGELFVVDLGSTNGTWLLRDPNTDGFSFNLKVNSLQRVLPGQAVKIGRTVIPYGSSYNTVFST